jgi:hypothetical protein
MRRVGVKQVDGKACNVIQSDEHRFAPEFRWLPRRSALKEKDFS